MHTAPNPIRHVRICALVSSEETRVAISEAVAGISGWNASIAADGLRSEFSSFDAHPPGIFIVELDPSDATEMKRFSELSAAMGRRSGLLLIVDRPSVSDMRTLLRLGASDVLTKPAISTTIREAIGHTLASAGGPTDQGTPQRGRVTCFLKASGGVGATMLAVQSACILADHKKGQSSACLLDFDLQFGSAALQLDIDHASSLIELPGVDQRFDGALFRSAIAHHACGVDVLPAPRSMQPLDAVSHDMAVTVVQVAAQEYSNVLVDMPLAWTVWSRAVLGIADAIVLVFRPEVPSIRQARRQMETLQAEGCGHIRLALVANACPEGLRPWPVKRKDAEAALGRAIDHVIPRADRVTANTVNFGLPLTRVRGGKPLARAVGRMIRSVISEQAHR